ncbi:MAG: RNA polymerase sigma factor [Steroidobacteraceae bacterium]
MPASEPAGLVALYAQYRLEILRFLRARTRDPAEAEDVIQELWIRLQAGRGGPVGNGRAYLFQMANNLVLDRARARRRRALRDQMWTEQSLDFTAGEAAAEPAPGPAESLLQAEELRQLTAAMQTLPDAARRAFFLHKIDGLSHAEVAAKLGISRSGVEKHIAVAMKHLRRALLD